MIIKCQHDFLIGGTCIWSLKSPYSSWIERPQLKWYMVWDFSLYAVDPIHRSCILICSWIWRLPKRLTKFDNGWRVCQHISRTINVVWPSVFVMVIVQIYVQMLKTWMDRYPIILTLSVYIELVWYGRPSDFRLAVNTRTVSDCWVLCHHRDVSPSLKFGSLP